MDGPVDDIDIATQLEPEATLAALETANIRAIPTGIEHGTITAIVDNVPFEITSLRRDVETDGRRAVVAFTEEWAEDAQRRDFLTRRLGLAGPGARLKRQAERLKFAQQRLPQSLRQLVAQRRQRMSVLVARLIAQQPGVRVRAQRRRLEHASVLLRTVQTRRIERLKTRLSVIATHLNAISPLATLERGYAIVRDESGAALHRIDQIRAGSKAQVLMSGGHFEATVDQVVPSETED